MNIYLTYDYELFFGTETGSAQKCILEPTNRIRTIANNTGAKMTFFIDAGYLKQLKSHQHYTKVKVDYTAIKNQIKTLVNEGHDCQLHIHPHWEDSYHDGEKWIMNVERYKLTDFTAEKLERIVLEYQSILKEITKKPVTIFRAGGWCLQPFSKIKKAFKAAGLRIDSTVFSGGKNTITPYYYDFTNCPSKDYWHFSDDICREDDQGEFIEYPISSYNYSALFFWKLFILGRLLPKYHKPIGNGFPVPSIGMRKTMLTKGKLLSASCDGYFVTKLDRIIKSNFQKGFKHTTVIGHPKALTEFSLSRLEKMIVDSQNNGHVFSTFNTSLLH